MASSRRDPDLVAAAGGGSLSGMESDCKRVGAVFSVSDGVISLWGRGLIWHTCCPLKQGLIQLSHLRSEFDFAGVGVKVSVFGATCVKHTPPYEKE